MRCGRRDAGVSVSDLRNGLSRVQCGAKRKNDTVGESDCDDSSLAGVVPGHQDFARNGHKKTAGKAVLAKALAGTKKPALGRFVCFYSCLNRAALVVLSFCFQVGSICCVLAIEHAYVNALAFVLYPCAPLLSGPVKMNP